MQSGSVGPKGGFDMHFPDQLCEAIAKRHVIRFTYSDPISISCVVAPHMLIWVESRQEMFLCAFDMDGENIDEMREYIVHNISDIRLHGTHFTPRCDFFTFASSEAYRIICRA